jgi:hypothetical protein
MLVSSSARGQSSATSHSVGMASAQGPRLRGQSSRGPSDANRSRLTGPGHSTGRKMFESNLSRRRQLTDRFPVICLSFALKGRS